MWHLQGRLLSDMSASELARSHKPPRVVHPLVATGLKQVRIPCLELISGTHVFPKVGRCDVPRALPYSSRCCACLLMSKIPVYRDYSIWDI